MPPVESAAFAAFGILAMLLFASAKGLDDRDRRLGLRDRKSVGGASEASELARPSRSSAPPALDRLSRSSAPPP